MLGLFGCALSTGENGEVVDAVQEGLQDKVGFLDTRVEEIWVDHLLHNGEIIETTATAATKYIPLSREVTSGTNLVKTGNDIFLSPTPSITSINYGLFSGGIKQYLNYNAAGYRQISFTDSTFPSSTTHPTLRFIVGGNITIDSIPTSGTTFLNLNLGSTAGSTVTIANTADATAVNTGGLRVLGGMSVSRTLFVGGAGDVRIDSTAATTFSMGGVGLFQIDYPSVVGGRFNIDNSGNVNIPRGVLLISRAGKSLTNATQNLLNFNSAGVNTPTFTTRSVGTKIILYTGLLEQPYL